MWKKNYRFSWEIKVRYNLNVIIIIGKRNWNKRQVKKIVRKIIGRYIRIINEAW